MPATAEIVCLGCDSRIIVFPSTVYGLVPADVEAAFLAELERTETEEGQRFAVADDVGMWTCPVCDSSSIVPVLDFN